MVERIPGGIICDKRLLSDRYHVILPVLDGHGEECQKKEYVSTEQSAQGNSGYIKNNVMVMYLPLACLLADELSWSYFR